MIFKILQIGDKRLFQTAKAVTELKSTRIQQLITDLLDTCMKGEKFTAGLAAPQVGQHLRISVIRRVDLEEKNVKPEELWEVLINPRIINQDKKEETLMWEGCLSVGVGKKMLYGPVYRPNFVEIEYEDRAGQTKRLAGTDYLSHVVQHEIDHLNGVLFISKVNNPENNLWAIKELDKYIKKNNRYPEVIE